MGSGRRGDWGMERNGDIDCIVFPYARLDENITTLSHFTVMYLSIFAETYYDLSNAMCQGIEDVTGHKL